MLTAEAAAQPSANRSEAQERFTRAVTLFEQRNFEGALAEFERVFQLTGRADLLFNISRTHEALGRYPEAASTMEDYLRRSADLPAERRAEVEQTLANVRRYIAYLRVRVAPEAASVRLDGQPLDGPRRAGEIPLSPGRHRLEASLQGHRSEEQTVVVASGDHREVSLSLRVDSSLRGTLRVEGAPSGAQVFVDGASIRPPASLGVGRHTVRVEAEGRAPWAGPLEVTAGVARTLRVSLARRDQLSPGWFYATAAAGGTLLVLGGVFGALTLSARSEFDTLFQDDPRVADVQRRGETFRALSNVSFGLGAVAAAAAVYLAFRTRFGPEGASTGTLVFRGDGVALQF
ncbi:MAG: PEGA domain-containing protein [Polyangiales bacterium]